jgi:hypothetical protein
VNWTFGPLGLAGFVSMNVGTVVPVVAEYAPCTPPMVSVAMVAVMGVDAVVTLAQTHWPLATVPGLVVNVAP